MLQWDFFKYTYYFQILLQKIALWYNELGYHLEYCIPYQNTQFKCHLFQLILAFLRKHLRRQQVESLLLESLLLTWET